jgi:hypothetical protein
MRQFLWSFDSNLGLPYAACQRPNCDQRLDQITIDLSSSVTLGFAVLSRLVTAAATQAEGSEATPSSLIATAVKSPSREKGRYDDLSSRIAGTFPSPQQRRLF